MNELVHEVIFSSGFTMQFVQGDLTVDSTDAIVIAANSSLLHCARVVWAILRQGGPSILCFLCHFDRYLRLPYDLEANTMLGLLLDIVREKDIEY
jgi:hypothetical protein